MFNENHSTTLDLLHKGELITLGPSTYAEATWLTLPRRIYTLFFNSPRGMTYMAVFRYTLTARYKSENKGYPLDGTAGRVLVISLSF